MTKENVILCVSAPVLTKPKRKDKAIGGLFASDVPEGTRQFATKSGKARQFHANRHHASIIICNMRFVTATSSIIRQCRRAIFEIAVTEVS